MSAVDQPVSGSVPTRAAHRPAPAPPRRQWPGAVVDGLVIAAAFGAVVLIGRAQDARGERILGVFDAWFLWTRGAGGNAIDWCERHAAALAWTISGVSALIAAVGLRARHRAAAPLVLAGVAVSLTAWGEAWLLGDAVALGGAAYGTGIAAAFVLGWWRPMRLLPGFPPFGAPTDAAADPGCAPWRPRWRTECAVVIGLALIALLYRTWALTELSDFLDLETVNAMVQSGTLHGIADYLRFTLLATNPGAAHLLPQWAVFSLFGTSIFTLRMAAVLWGVASVPLMYWLVRRLAGPFPAIIAAGLMAVAPDQLFWSRSENGFFAPVAVFALVMVHVGLWLMERFSPAALLAAAVCMPLSRFFYTTCLAMFLYPILLAGHTVVFVRRAWRKLWFVAPVLAAGFVAWVFSVSIVLAALNGQWKFAHPAQIYGGPAWTKQGEFTNAAWPDLLRLQAASMGENLVHVARDMTYKTENGFSHWYMRAQAGPHSTTVNVGLVVLLALGAGYLLAQLRDPRAFALLVWLGLSLLPGIMSQEASPRRMSMLFPVAHAIAALFAGAFVRIARESGGRGAARLAGGAVVAGLAVVAFTNSVSHFRLPMQSVIFGDYLRFTEPVFAESDALFFNVPLAFRTFLLFGNLDRFLTTPTCHQGVAEGGWLEAALDPHCDFNDVAYRLTMSDAEVAALRHTYEPRRISYVFFVDPTTEASLALVRALYPRARSADYLSPRDSRRIAAVTIDAADSAALRMPELRMAAPPVDPPAVLAGVRLQLGGSPAEGAEAGASVVAGGIRLDADGWYRFSLQPACPQATLRIGDHPTDAAAALPMLSGVHPFTLTLPDLQQCRLPLQVLAQRAGTDGGPPAALAPGRFVSPAVLAVPSAQAPPVHVDDGYAGIDPSTQLQGRAMDFAVGPDGTLHVVLNEQGRWRLRRFAPDGRPLGGFDLDGPAGREPTSIDVGADGTVAVLFSPTVVLYDPSGKRVGSWDNVWFVRETQIALLGRDLVLATIPHRNSIAVLTRTGELVREFASFRGGPRGFYQPTTLRLNSTGDLLVLQANGQALLFRTPTDTFDPVFVRSFTVPATASTTVFDGPERILIAADGGVQVFDPTGERMMAADPARDLGRRRFGPAARLGGAAGRLYVLDPEGQRLWSISR